MPEDDDSRPPPAYASLPYRPLRRRRPYPAVPCGEGTGGPLGRPDLTDDLGWLSLLELAFDDELLQGRR